MRERPVLRNAGIIFASLALLVYLIWRIGFTFPDRWSTLPSYILAGIVIAVELFGAFETLVFYLGAADFKRPEIPSGAVDNFPEVDIFITTLNEPLEVVSKTVEAALNLEYPNTVNIYLCDDGKRNEFAKYAQSVRINYIARNSNQHAKAGNLNNAFRKTKSSLIANFDADMAPRPDFLMKTVPFFYPENGQEIEYSSAKIGFVQTPQNFVGPDIFSRYLKKNNMANEQDYFYRAVQLTKNGSNSVIYGGSNTLLSRQALNSIQGFNKDTLTEDFATGMLLQDNGYVGIGVDEVLADGVSPYTLSALFKQRQRWARGVIQVFRRLHIFRRSGLDFSQKLNYFASVSYWFFPLKWLFFTSMPIVVAFSGLVVARFHWTQFLLFWLPMFGLSALILHIISKGSRKIFYTYIYEFVLSPYLFLTVISELFTRSKNNTFVVTGKTAQSETISSKILFSLPYIVLFAVHILAIKQISYTVFAVRDYYQIITLCWLLVDIMFIVIALYFVSGEINILFKLVAPIIVLVLSLVYVLPTVAYGVSNPVYNFPRMSKGINIGNALEAPRGEYWGVVLNHAMIDATIWAGFDNIRVPIRFSDYLDSDNKIDPLLIAKLDDNIDYAINSGLTVTIDVHHFEDLMANPSDSNQQKLVAIWQQLSEHYKDYPKELVFELLNEPSGEFTTNMWNELIPIVLNVVRKENSTRAVIVDTPGFSDVHNIWNLEVPDNDPYLMVAFHYYDPKEFAFQNNEDHPDYQKYVDITWNQNDGAKDKDGVISDVSLKQMNEVFTSAYDYGKAKKVRVVVNEFGTVKKANEKDRIAWTQTVRQVAESHNFAWSYWEMASTMGIYNADEKVWNENMLKALLN